MNNQNLKLFIQIISEKNSFQKILLQNILDSFFLMYLNNDIEKESFEKELYFEYKKKDKKINQPFEIISQIFDFTNLEIDYITINKTFKILKNKNIKFNFFTDNINNDLISFCLNYKNHLLKKHYYSLIYNLNNLNFIDKSISLEELFNLINRNSLNNKDIFTKKDNKFYINFTPSKYPFYCFLLNDKYYGIDVFINNENNYNFINNYINLHYLVNNIDIDKDFSINDFKKLISSNIIYFLCFNNEPEYDKITFEDSNMLYLYSISSREQNKINNLFFIENIHNLDYNIDTLIERKSFWLNIILKSYSDSKIDSYLKTIYPENNNPFILIKRNINNNLINYFKNFNKNEKEHFLNFLKSLDIKDNSEKELIFNEFKKNFFNSKEIKLLFKENYYNNLTFKKNNF